MLQAFRSEEQLLALAIKLGEGLSFIIAGQDSEVVHLGCVRGGDSVSDESSSEVGRHGQGLRAYASVVVNDPFGDVLCSIVNVLRGLDSGPCKQESFRDFRPHDKELYA